MKVEDVEFLNERVEQGAEKALIKEKLSMVKENLANAINGEQKTNVLFV